MEDIDQKLNSGNIFVQTQAITSLNDRIHQQAKDSSCIYETAEVKKLWATANCGDLGPAAAAIECLVSLVKEGLLPAPATLQNFLADVGTARSPTALVQGISQLLFLLCESYATGDDADKGHMVCPFTGPPSGPTHPYVLLVIRKPDLTWTVLDEISYIIHSPNTRVNSAKLSFIQPLLLHALCLSEATTPIARPLLETLAVKHALFGDPLVLLLCKTVTMIKSTSDSHLERKMMVLNCLSQIALSAKNQRLAAALLPCLVVCLSQAVVVGLPARSTERYMSTIASHLGQGCDITICALAEALPYSSGSLQVNLLRAGATLLSYRDGNPIVASRLLPSLLQVLAAPCTAIPGLATATAALLNLIQVIPIQVSANAQLSGNLYWDTLSNTFPVLATYIPAIDLCNQIIKNSLCASDWLNKLASTVHEISDFHHKIVTAVFLYQGSTCESVQLAAKVLEKEVSKRNSLSLELFPMILYRLGKDTDPQTQLTLLYLLPSIAVNKLSVALVLKTFLALWTSESLRPVILRLMLDLWKVESRVFSYLSQLISDLSFNSQEMQISRAYVVAEVCRTKPSQHGEELLPLLSSFLNECRGKEGTAQTMIALDGIYELCSASVIDLRTTWKVIEPKLAKDKRLEVTVKLCQLLSLTPKLEVKSAEFEAFTTSTVTTLWSWATGKAQEMVNKAAFKALEMFPVASFRLKMLPTYMKEGHKLPSHLAATPLEAARKAEDVLDYVPGLAWVKLLVGCPREQLACAESFVKHLVEKELLDLPREIYLTAIQEAKQRGCKSVAGQPEPPSYSFLPHASVLRALVSFLQDFSKLLVETVEPDKRERLLQAAKVSLVALGQPLSRPFPALDWSFLNEIMRCVDSMKCSLLEKNWPSQLKHGIFRIGAQQCNKSASALNIMKKFLSPDISTLTSEDEIMLFSLYDQLGRGLSPDILQPFVSLVLKKSVENPSHLKLLLDATNPHITSAIVQEPNRNVISGAIESLYERIDPSDKQVYDSFKSCVAGFSQKHIERLTSPSLWWEITDEKLYRAAILRCHVASNDPECNALPWLNDIVDSAAILPGDRSHFLQLIAETLVVRSSTEESTNWLLGLMGRMLEYLKKKPDDNLVLYHEHQQRITFYADILVMGLLIWSGLWATCPLDRLSSSPLIRNSLLPPALVSLWGRPDWTHVFPQLLNWLLSCYSLVETYTGKRYQLKNGILLLSALSPSLSQSVWNKVVGMAM